LPEDKLKLRYPLDVQLVQPEVLMFRCPLGLTEPLFLNREVAKILPYFQGDYSKADLLTIPGVSHQVLDFLIARFNSHLLLDNKVFQDESQKVIKSFVDQEVRLPALAGTAYPNQSSQLTAQLSSYINNQNSVEKDLIGIMSPHIDYRRGGYGYGLAYSGLGKNPHDLYLLMGTAHQYSESLVILTKKDFLTPLGRVKCERELVTRVLNKYGTIKGLKDEYLHKNEHSLELQLPFLQLQVPSPVIVPILVGSFHNYLVKGELPDEDPAYLELIHILAEVLSDTINMKQRLGIIAGVDMAHIGQQFGDSFILSDDKLAEIRIRDTEYLEILQRKDRIALFSHIYSDNDARRICGFPTMYIILHLLEVMQIEFTCEIVDYRQAVDDQKVCGVTFASAHFF
jgi:MEMO1 family protein